jgi:hypothetical protein
MIHGATPIRFGWRGDIDAARALVESAEDGAVRLPRRSAPAR